MLGALDRIHTLVDCAREEVIGYSTAMGQTYEHWAKQYMHACQSQLQANHKAFQEDKEQLKEQHQEALEENRKAFQHKKEELEEQHQEALTLNPILRCELEEVKRLYQDAMDNEHESVEPAEVGRISTRSMRGYKIGSKGAGKNKNISPRIKISMRRHDEEIRPEDGTEL